MNLVSRISLIAVLTAVAQWFGPWWVCIPIALIIEAIFGKHKEFAFFSGFYGVCIPWLLYALYQDQLNDSLLSVRIAALFKLPQFGFVLVIITGLIGGVAGGIGSLTGSWLKEWKMKYL